MSCMKVVYFLADSWTANDKNELFRFRCWTRQPQTLG
jgi:hypothetical protein